MLNELIYGSHRCPVCGRYGCFPLEDWWCPYCGPSLSAIALQEIETLSERIAALEEIINTHFPQEEQTKEIEVELDDEDW